MSHFLFFISTPFLAFIYNAPSLASAAEDITALMISAALCMAPLLGGEGHIFGEIVMSPRAASCIWFIGVPGIAVDG